MSSLPSPSGPRHAAGKLEGRVAFVTGAARGQGRSHALHLAAEGADIIALDACRDIASAPYPMAEPDELRATAEQIEALGRRVVTIEADVRDRAAMTAGLDDAVASLGRLDIVVANAGIWSTARAVDMPIDTWQEMIDINLTGSWNTCQLALPHMLQARQGGSIILVSSAIGLRSAANVVHYSAAKHGLVGIMRSLANELAPKHIRVNCLHPTTVDTPMIHNGTMYGLFRPDLDEPTLEDVLPAFRRLNPIPIAWIEANDVSNAVVFLASDDSRYITSVSLPVDAGSTQR